MAKDHDELIEAARQFLASFNLGDPVRVMGFFSDEPAYEDGYGRRFEGVDEVRNGLASLFDGTFGKPQYVVEDLFCDASASKVLATWRCDLEINGEPAAMHGLDILHFDSDRRVSAKLAFIKAEAPQLIM